MMVAMMEMIMVEMMAMIAMMVEIMLHNHNLLTMI
jgi:hypothetical protein